MGSLQYEYECEILKKHKRYKNLRTSLFDKPGAPEGDILIDTKDYKSFINNEDYKEFFRHSIYTFLRSILGFRYSTCDGINISVQVINKFANVEVKYEDYNNYNWDLIPNKIQSALAKSEIYIKKVSEGYIKFRLPCVNTNIQNIKLHFKTDNLIKNFESFMDFIFDTYDKYNINLSNLSEVVHNIIYYEYNQRLLVKLNKEEIKIIKQ